MCEAEMIVSANSSNNHVLNVSALIGTVSLRYFRQVNSSVANYTRHSEEEITVTAQTIITHFLCDKNTLSGLVSCLVTTSVTTITPSHCNW